MQGFIISIEKYPKCTEELWKGLVYVGNYFLITYSFDSGDLEQLTAEILFICSDFIQNRFCDMTLFRYDVCVYIAVKKVGKVASGSTHFPGREDH